MTASQPSTRRAYILVVAVISCCRRNLLIGLSSVPAFGCDGVGFKPVPALRGVSVPGGGSRPFGPACPHPPGLRPPFCGAWLDSQRPAQPHPTSQELHWGSYTPPLARRVFEGCLFGGCSQERNGDGGRGIHHGGDPMLRSHCVPHRRESQRSDRHPKKPRRMRQRLKAEKQC